MKHRLHISRGLQLLLLWLVLASTHLPFTGFTANEVDVLPDALQQVDPDWLPGDWFLNREILYRVPFGAVAGRLAATLGLAGAAIVLRLLLDLVMAAAMDLFLRALGLRFALRLLVVALFVHHQSLIAREWMVGGAETKPLAYAAVLASLAFLVRRRWSAGFACAGFALAAHVLVGGYALACAGAAWLAEPGRLRREMPRILRRIWLVPLLGAPGIVAVLEQLGGSDGGATREAYAIYVEHRVPHHLLPSAWEPGWPWSLLGATLFLLLTRFGAPTRRVRRLADVGLAAAGLFLVGLAIARFADVAWLRFYWFRLPDVLLPWLVLALGAAWVERALRGHRPRLGAARRPVGAALTVAAGIVVLFAAVDMARRPPPPEPIAAFDWIREQTPRDAVFLADPMLQSFYVDAERAVFATWKHAPHAAPDVLAWYDRLLELTGGVPPAAPGSWRDGELQARFYRLPPAAIRDLAARHGLTHYVGLTRHAAPLARERPPDGFETLYRDELFVIYRLR